MVELKEGEIGNCCTLYSVEEKELENRGKKLW